MRQEDNETRGSRRRKQSGNTVEQGRLMTRSSSLKRTLSVLVFEGVVKDDKIVDKKPEDRADEGSKRSNMQTMEMNSKHHCVGADEGNDCILENISLIRSSCMRT